jgi:hypothetical protein
LSIDSVVAPIRIDVTTGSRTSPIWIGEGVSHGLAALLDQHSVGARRFVVSNPAVWRFHGTHIQASLGGTDPILIPDGERYKNLQSVSKIYEALIRAGRIAAASSSPSVAASSATPPASPQPRFSAGSRSSTSRRRCWPRWTAPSAARSASIIRSGRI